MSDPDFLTCEISRTRTERRHTRRRLRGWLGLALALVAVACTVAESSWVVSVLLVVWAWGAVWEATLCAHAAAEAKHLIEWMGGTP